MSNLQHFRVLVTRPRPQGEELCTQLQALGFDTAYLPVMEIKPLADLTGLKTQIAQLDQYDWAIFVSRSAVAMSEALIKEKWPELPANLKIAAVGEGTAQSLQQAALPAHLYPAAEWSSEGLLDMPELQNVTGKKIAIFCGEGGREFLADSLQARGAKVTCLLCYQRVLSQVDLTPFLDLLRNEQIDAMLATSMQGLQNLKQLFAKTEWRKLKKIPLVLVSERIMIQAKDLGFEHCYLAKDASHQSLAQALQKIRKEVMTSQEMHSEETQSQELDAKAAQAAAQAGVAAKNSVMTKVTLTTLCLLIILVIAAGSLIYYRIFLLNQQVKSALTSIAHQVKWNAHQIADLQTEYAQVLKRMQNEEATLSQQNQVLQDVHGLTQNGASTKGRDHGLVLDAQYFVRLASDQLTLTHDVPLALTYLNQAQTVLNPVSDTRAATLKKSLEQDIEALKKLPQVNTTDIYQSILTLQASIEQLPLVVVPTPNTPVAASTEESTSQSAWGRAWQRFVSALRQMVVVYHVPSAQTPPFITPDQGPYLYANLRATLSNASWALLHNNPKVYRSSLEQALTWTQQFFSQSAEQTQAFIAQLQKLEEISLEPSSDLVLSSPKAFQDYLIAEPAKAAPSV